MEFLRANSIGALRFAAACYMLSASFHAGAYDAARCSELQGNLRKLDGYIAGSPTASDRQRYLEARAAQAKLLPYVCGNGPAAAGGASGRAPSLGAPSPLPPVIGGVLNSLPPADAYQVAPPPPGPPEPPRPSGSVQGPMTMQRLSSGASGTAPAMQSFEQGVASGFPSDDDIARACAASPNPSSCALVRENQRNADPGYQRWKAAEAARQQSNIDRSLQNIDAAIAAAGTNPPNAAVIPVAPGPMPYDNSDPDLAKCREGEKDPWTIAGCYDLRGKPAAKAPAEPFAKAHSGLREQLRRRLAEKDDGPAADGAASDGPNRDPANEARQIAEWKSGAQARLAAALASGASVVPENKSARAGCDGWWLYDGLSAGRCEPGRHRLVYAVDPPSMPARAEPAPPVREEPFAMDPAETEREVQRMLGTLK